MIDEYLPVLIQLAFALAIAGGGLITSMLIGKAGAKQKEKGTAYECGKEAQGTSSPRFSVKFYLIAMIFILFDIEVIFMYPWALSFSEMVRDSLNILWAMIAFVLIIEVGHWYAYKKGVFDWNKP
ncbi:MAG: NADH-quinone oxidoreductase subunit A [Verrucomicrobiota bacterium]